MANFAEYAIESAGVPPAQTNADAFGYNARGEVVSASIGADLYAHSYDGIGNHTLFAANAMTNTYSANNLNQYSSILCASVPLCELSYDLDGNLLSDGVWSYAYDADGRLFSSTSASLTNGAIRVLNAYDYRHRRTSKTVQRLHSTIPPPPSPPVGEFEWRTVETRTFVYDDWHLIHETVCTIEGGVTNLSEIQHFWGLDLSGTLQGAGGVGGLLATSVNGDYYFPAYDNNGNVTKYIDESGAVVAAYEYDDFGGLISASGPMADIFSHRFSTKYFDSETGLYYYGYRYYSPPLMRWLNRDPIEEQGGLNLYAMCGNKMPWSFDPFGENRYITQFDILNLGGSGGTQIHVGVAVDLWECEKNEWRKTGVETYDFQIDYTKGLGNVIVGISGLAKGRILVSKGLNLRNPLFFPSNPRQDMEMRRRIMRDVQNPPLYNVFFYNCIVWAVEALNYGMEE